MKRKLPPNTNGRETLPDNVDVRPIPGCPGYLVTESGEVYSDTDPPLKMAARDYMDYTGRKTMRRRVKLSHSGRAREHYVAALVLEAWVGPRPDGAVAQHYDEDTLNCRRENLFWGYPQSRIDPAEFVKIWQSAQSVREVAERIGKSYPTTAACAKKMRDNGVPLREIAHHAPSEEDYAALAELAKKLAEEQP